jgi:2-polyprenyl-6-methoxyphenol hydroxylase-like FAD-dependent oxidoreductase/predicted DsbA family dithiol-disulfide isomerase
MNDTGKAVVQNILNESDVLIPGSEIDTFILRDADNAEIKNISLEPWRCVRRMELVKVLLNCIDPSDIRYGRSFSHFLYENNQAIAAVFENGEIEYGDMFVGADGCHSKVRQSIFGKTKFTNVEVQEILGTINNPELVSRLRGVFSKYQHKQMGLSFGCIPFSENELIWYSQFDVNLTGGVVSPSENLQNLTEKLLKDFPEEVHDILNQTDFSNAYLWSTKDFDPLQSFHKENVVLIGDAAHVALPFTSAGTSDALFDAECLSSAIESEKDFESAFQLFYNNRISSITEHNTHGRRLKQAFLNPNADGKNEFEVPLVDQKKISSTNKVAKNKMEILYFTDPICSTCWSMQPHLRKFKINYSGNFDFEHVMGGLLPSWNNFNRGGITQPEDVYPHWLEELRHSGMPVDGTIWLSQPLSSSFPPSIAFKAADLQNKEKAVALLRRLNEYLFIYNLNIATPNVISTAAEDVGLDVSRLLKDWQNAETLFHKDLRITAENHVVVFPTMIFKMNGEVVATLKGEQDYASMENIFLQYNPDCKKNFINDLSKEIFKNFDTITFAEFKYINNHSSNREAKQKLNSLLNEGYIIERKSPAGSLFLSTIAA